MSPAKTTGTGAGRTAPVFAALGEETRLTLLARLSSDGPRSISALTSGTLVTRQAITKHLLVLAQAGLVRDVRRGRERIWELEPQQLDEASAFIRQISRRWDERLQRLKGLVEDPG